MHTGINTGLVVVRRSDARAGDYALTGDAVNTAARLRGRRHREKCSSARATWRLVADHFEADECAPVEVKGKEQPLGAWRIRAARHAPRRGEVALVGRDEELSEFRAIAQACAERKRSRVVIVRGDPGVGKSRLVAEFVAAAEAMGFSCHGAAVLDFGAATGRDAVRSLARSLLGCRQARAPTSAAAPSSASPAGASIADEHRVFLHDLLDLGPPPDLRALAAAMSTASTREGLPAGALRARDDGRRGSAAPGGVEDIHWADPWTLERLAALAVLAATPADGARDDDAFRR